MVLHKTVLFTSPLPLHGNRPAAISRSQTWPVDKVHLNQHKKVAQVIMSSSKQNDSRQTKSRSIKSSALPYFAYFANMNPNTLGPNSRISLRRVRLHSSKPARLPRFKLKLDLYGLPPEPVFANLAEDRENENGIHGVLHWLSDADFERVARSEGVASLSLPSFGKVLNVTCVQNDGAKVKARTIVFRPPPLPNIVGRFLLPSRRYVKTAIDGAEFHGVEHRYIDNVLRRIRTADGLLGGFGLAYSPRPHLLDRPNPQAEFRKPEDEIYSPLRRLPKESETAVRRMREKEEKEGDALHLVRLSSKPRPTYKKKLYYIPGIDGNGKSILTQIDKLEEEGLYDVSGVIYPPGNRQTLPQIAAEIIRLIKLDAGEQPVTIVGQSMGGMLSLVCARENQARHSSKQSALNIEVMLLINPASCYKRSSTRTLWNTLLSIGLSEQVYSSLLPLALLPFIMDADSFRESFGPDQLQRLRKLLSSLYAIADVLPSHAVAWRLEVLDNFYMSADEYKSLTGAGGAQKIAVIATVNDNLIPSLSELNRLERLIPGLYGMVLPFGGHTPTFDRRFNLAAYLHTFNVDHERKTNDDGAAFKASEGVLKRREALRKKFASKNGTVKLSEQKIRRLSEYLKKSLADNSPVFVGEENISALDSERPVLFVSNHSLLGWLDGMHPVLRLLRRRGVLVHALAHPQLFRSAQVSFPNTPNVDVQDFEQYGIFKVSRTALVEQLANGKWVLLFPGGAKEALKDPRGQKYALNWPSDPEFVRSCALFGAQIVPLSTVGTEDCYRPFLSGSQVKRIVELGGMISGRNVQWENFRDDVETWRSGKDEGTLMVPPLPIPGEPDRLYYRFGKAIQVDGACVSDARMEREVYERTKRAVGEGIEILLKRRMRDAYRSIEKRKEFVRRFGEEAEPPAGEGWLWKRNGMYLDEDLQPLL